MSLEWKVLLQLLTYISILIEEVVYPRSLCLGVDIWNKYSLVLSPLYTSWYTAVRAQLVYIHCERKTVIDGLYTTHFKYCHLSHLKHPKYSEILLHSEHTTERVFSLHTLRGGGWVSSIFLASIEANMPLTEKKAWSEENNKGVEVAKKWNTCAKSNTGASIKRIICFNAC